MENLKEFITLDMSSPIWDHFYTIAPLVIVGTKEGAGYDMAPKHMAMPIGFDNYFGFVCTPNHSTYHNILENKEFSVSFPIPDQILLTSLSASPRSEVISKSDQIISALPTIKSDTIDTLLIADSYLHLECKLFKIIDGFNTNSIITGTICKASVHKDYARISEKDEDEQIHKNPLLAYVANGRFATISKTFNFPFPKNFTR
ncbi:flavin reductase [Aquimarina rubra]|uniref:Flavin reductase n=1 Tax=Aquimarina rubra TaxID=1920033 RepID=A0ABW5LKN7_9FLAO